MFSQLIESGRPSRRPGAQSFLSLAFHLVLGLGAIEASQQVVVRRPGRRWIPSCSTPAHSSRSAGAALHS